jgi:polyisoprenoid-binding protein YceI
LEEHNVQAEWSDMKPTDMTNDLTIFTGTWALNSKRTSVTFRTKAMWVVPVKGTVKALGGDAEVTPDGAVTGTLVIDAASFDTKNAKRDDHLRSEHFFEVAKYPTIVFTATGGHSVGAGLVEITGTLTVHGQTQPMTFRAEVSGSGNSATVSTVVDIDRGMWGMSWIKMGARLKNHVAIVAHFDRT